MTLWHRALHTPTIPGSKNKSGNNRKTLATAKTTANNWQTAKSYWDRENTIWECENDQNTSKTRSKQVQVQKNSPTLSHVTPPRAPSRLPSTLMSRMMRELCKNQWVRPSKISIKGHPYSRKTAPMATNSNSTFIFAENKKDSRQQRPRGEEGESAQKRHNISSKKQKQNKKSHHPTYIISSVIPFGSMP